MSIGMLKLKSKNEAPAGGFRFVDKATGFRAHGWSIRATAAQWYQEQLNRGRNVTIDQAIADVERFTCEDLMKSPGWDQWVMVVTPPDPFRPAITFKQKETSVSVVIPCQFTERLNRVVDYVRDTVNEIVIVMNEHEKPLENEKPEVFSDSKVKLFYTPPNSKDLGFGEKCNLGAKYTKSEFIWFLNDDCYPSPGCRDHLVNVLLANPKIGMVGHLLRYPNGLIQHAGTKQ